MAADAEAILKRLDGLKGERGTWESHWQECCDYVLPRKAQITLQRSPGDKRTTELFDSTAILDNERMAAGLYSYLCPANKRWFEFQQKRPGPTDEVKRWFSEATRITYEAIQNSNFSLQAHELFQDLGVTATGCLYVEDGEKSQLSFRAYSLPDFWICEDWQGRPDTVYRQFRLTARQAVQQFGEENLGEKIREAARTPAQYAMQFDFVHAVYPRQERDEKKLDKENMPYASVYIDVTGKRVVQEGGYQELPYMTPRFSKDPKETYGRGPAIAILPEIKMLNAMKRTIIKNAEKLVDPPLCVPDNDKVSRVRTTPNALMYCKTAPSGQMYKPEPLNIGARIDIGLDMVQDQREQIHQAFYADLFAMLLEYDGPQMTASEVMARLEEKLTIFAPTYGRLQSELFDPMLHRIFGLLMQAGAFPPPPEELMEDGEYEIVYVSKIALAMKALDVKAFMDTLNVISPLATADPTIMDNFDLDAIAQGTGSRFGVPNEFQRSKEDVKKLRAARAAAAQEAENKAMALEAAKAIPNLQKPTDPASPLAQFAGGLAGG